MLAELPLPDSPQPSQKNPHSAWIVRGVMIVQLGVILFQQLEISQYARAVQTWQTSANHAWSAMNAASKQVEEDHAQFAEDKKVLDHCRDVMAQGSDTMKRVTTAMKQQNETIAQFRRLMALYEPYTRYSSTSGVVKLTGPQKWTAAVCLRH